jgi:hypothetical protein
MSGKIDLGLKPDHVGGGFKWEMEPTCSCGRLKDAVAERFIFVSNFNDNGSNIFYMMPVDADGDLVRSDGIPISFCPWCGEKIFGHKFYPAHAKDQ